MRAKLTSRPLRPSNRVKLSGGEDERENFFHEKCGPYLGMARLLIRDGKPFEALQYSERAKARLLLDVLRGAHDKLQPRDDAGGGETDAERDLTNQIDDHLDAELASQGAQYVKPGDAGAERPAQVGDGFTAG